MKQDWNFHEQEAQVIHTLQQVENNICASATPAVCLDELWCVLQSVDEKIWGAGHLRCFGNGRLQLHLCADEDYRGQNKLAERPVKRSES